MVLIYGLQIAARVNSFLLVEYLLSKGLSPCAADDKGM